jgi:hypothetical protein
MPDLWLSCNTFFLLYESFFSKRKSLTLLLARGGRHVACQKSFGEFFSACYLSVFPAQTFRCFPHVIVRNCLKFGTRVDCSVRLTGYIDQARSLLRRVP